MSHRSLWNDVRGFRRDDRANVAVIFALIVVPVLMMVGSAIDYGESGDLVDASAMRKPCRYILRADVRDADHFDVQSDRNQSFATAHFEVIPALMPRGEQPARPM